MEKDKNSEYWEKRIASEAWKVYNSLEEKNKELLQFYINASESVKDELYRLAEKYSKDGVLSLSEMYKQNRLAELNKKYESIIKELGHTTEEFTKRNMQQGFQDVYEKTAKGMGDNDFSMPNKKLMEKMMETPWRGDNFSGRLWKNQKKLVVSLNDVLLTGLQQGKTVTEIAIALHNRMGQGFNDCHRLVKTESMHYLNNATLQRYKDAGVRYVQIWAALDERTCKTCGSYHGKIYPIDKCPAVPFHANCRCTILPVTDEKMISEYEKEDVAEVSKDDRIRSIKEVQQDIDSAQAEIDKMDDEISKLQDSILSRRKKKEISDEDALLRIKELKEKIRNRGAVIENLKNELKKFGGEQKKEKSNLIKMLEKEKIEFRKVTKYRKKVTESEIIDNISGEDKTKGSCASLGLAYIGNKNGYQCLDFRGGISRDWFSSKANKLTMWKELEVNVITEDSFKGCVSNGKKILSNVEKGKEYYLSVGKHAAIVRKTEGGILQYLELQSSEENGWKDFSENVRDTLLQRFKCGKLNGKAYLTDIGQLDGNEEFIKVLGYINTLEDAQLKGVTGYVR